MSQWGDIYPGVRMGVRKWTSTLFLVALVGSLPGYSQTDNNRLIVRFKTGITTFSADSIHRALGIRSQKKLQQLKNIEVVELPKNISLEAAKQLYSKNPNVLYVEPDFKIRVKPIKGSAIHKKNEQFEKQ